MAESTPNKYPNKGRLFTDLRPRKCSNCPDQVPIDQRALYLDVRVFTESGWRPLIDEEAKQHWYWIFCSIKCMQDFLSRTKDKGDLLGLK